MAPRKITRKFLPPAKPPSALPASESDLDGPNRFFYAYAKPLKLVETILHEQGYKFVNTNTLMGGDRLNHHKHHSENTHFVVSSTLKTGKTALRDGNARDYKKFQQWDVAPETCYYAEAGEEGCVFVEGHRRLSVSTADRFVDRGQFERIDGSKVEWFRGTRTYCGREVFEAKYYEPELSEYPGEKDQRLSVLG